MKSRHLREKTMNEWVSGECDKIPSDRYVVRWHKLWKCPIAVKYNFEKNGWIDKTLNTIWPSLAFTNHYMELLQPPEEL